MKDMCRIYVASSWRNEYQPRVVEAFRAARFPNFQNPTPYVYDFRNPVPGDYGFSWKECEQDGQPWQQWTPRQFVKALEHPIAQKGFAHDLAGIHPADLTVLVLPAGRSAHLEFGFAAGAAQLKVVYIPEELADKPGAVEPELMLSWADGFFFDLGECVKFCTNIANWHKA